MYFTDIHTHSCVPAPKGSIIIQNFTQQDFEGEFLSQKMREFEQNIHDIQQRVKWVTLGLHPWFLTDENVEKDFQKLTQLVDNQRVIAVGECGLDRLRGENLLFQMRVLEDHIRLAERVSKPVIIHCVKAFNELIAVQKKMKPTVPLIVHGFNKNSNILSELLQNGFYISVGASILRGSHFHKTLREIPLNRLFFETDDALVPISDVYEAAAQILEIEISDLKSTIYTNFKTVFNKF